MKAVCLGLHNAPKLGQINVKIMEQKLVQCCETKVDTEGCHALYVLYTFYPENIFLFNKMKVK